MSKSCENIELFVDGELEAARAEAFRVHLAECPSCQAELVDLMQPKALTVRYYEAKAAMPAASRPSARLSRWRRYSVLAAAAGLVLVVAAGITWRGRQHPDSAPALWLVERPRQIEARTSYAPADVHRAMGSKMMGTETSAEVISLHVLATLEERGDHQGIAAAYLVRNQVDEALRRLQGLPSSPGVDNDRAAAHLLKNEHEQALRLLESVLAQDPRHAQALWNRGLVLRELGLTALAARSFDEVARLGEAGWSQEAAEKARALHQEMAQRHQGWKDATAAGEALIRTSARRALPAVAVDQEVTGMPPTEALVRNHHSLLRLFFYDAVRVAASTERAQALLPLAKQLDERVGGTVLASYVEQVAARDFSRRSPRARAYAQLREGTLPKDEIAELMINLLRTREDGDILLGVLVQTGSIRANLDTFEARAQASGDPWFRIYTLHERARAARAAGELTQARQQLEEARQICRTHRLPFRCVGIEVELSTLLLVLGQFETAKTYAEEGLKLAREGREWEREIQILQSIAQVARLRDDIPLARVYSHESLERAQGNRAQESYFHQQMAALSIAELRFDRARMEIDQALATEVPLDLMGAYSLVDISRVRPAIGDEAALEAALEAVTANPRLSPGRRVIVTSIRGRFFMERDQEKGRDLHRRAIEDAAAEGLQDRDTDARRARAYSYSSLILAEGKVAAYDRALALFAEEMGSVEPRRCVVAVTADNERALMVARGADGSTQGRYEGSRTEQLGDTLEGLVPDSVLISLRPCEQVDVIARAPLHARAGILPPDMAWSYRVRLGAPRPPPPGRAIHLVVRNVAMDPGKRSLRNLNNWKPGFGSEEEQRLVEGSEATPSRVLREIMNATEIDVVAHGVIDESSDSTYLVLAPEGVEKHDVLRHDEIRRHALRGAPFVVLAACHAARATPILYAPVSLPTAFIEAGARGVIAATVEIPDLEVNQYLNAVRERIRNGATPAGALCEERMKWLNEVQQSSDLEAAKHLKRKWINSVLIFE